MAIKLVRHRPVRVGVVGCGVVAEYGHIPAIHGDNLAEIVGFADPDAARRDAMASKYGKPAFAGLEEMIAGVPMDVVTLATPPSARPELIRLAASHGLHAFCEKPLADTLEQSREMVRRMDDAGLMIGMAFVYRGRADVQRMMELVREGAIGTLRAVHLENMWDYHGYRGEAWGPAYVGRRRRALRNLGTLDCGIHHLDLARYLTGSDFGDIAAIGAIVEKDNVFPDHLIVHSRMTGGVLVAIEESAVWGHTAADKPPYQQSYRMVGDQGALHAAPSGDDPHTATLHVVSGARQWQEILHADKAWDGVYRQFFQTLLGDPIEHLILADGHDGLAAMAAADAILRSCQAQNEPEA
ncbi:MAG: Gfo/Idh/MocA family oxidoreductase [Phycisphaeraceae bacterium]|nr:Gfo/Idh/MocA family oxidoreductase [Phycisphaeraceae bacterium]